MKERYLKKSKAQIEKETLEWCKQRKGNLFTASEEIFLNHKAEQKKGFLDRLFYNDARSERERISEYLKDEFETRVSAKCRYVDSYQHLKGNAYEQKDMKPYGVEPNESNKGFWWCVLGIVFLALLIKFL